MSLLGKIKHVAGKVADYTPIVSNVKGAVTGDKAQALGGPAVAATRDAEHVTGLNGQQVGALGGGIVGSVVPGAGTVVGAGLGGALGAGLDKYDASRAGAGGGGAGGAGGTGGFDDARRRAAGVYDQAGADVAGAHTDVPMVGAPIINDAQGQEIRARQLGNLDMLTGAANGTAPSAAQAQLAGQVQDIAAQQQGLAGQARGTAAVASRRDAMANIADSRRRAALDMSQLRANEMATARGQLTGALTGVRTADTGLATDQVGLSLKAAQGDQSAALQGQQITNAYKLGRGGQQLDANGQIINAQKGVTDAAHYDQTRTDNLYKSGAEALGTLAKTELAPRAAPPGTPAAPATPDDQRRRQAASGMSDDDVLPMS